MIKPYVLIALSAIVATVLTLVIVFSLPPEELDVDANAILLRSPNIKGQTDFYSGATVDFLGGSLVPATDSEDDLGSSTVRFKTVYADSVDASASLNFSGTFDGDFVSETDGTDDLGSTSKAWLHSYTDTIVVNERLDPDADGGASLGTTSLRFLAAFFDTLYSNFLISISANGYIDGGAGVAGTATFTTSDTMDTVAFASAAAVDANSIFVVSLVDTTFEAGVGAMKGYVSKADTLFVARKPGGTSAAKWAYQRIQ